MRSFRELLFRLRQEFANLHLYLLPPTPALPSLPTLPLPDPNSFLPLLRNSSYASEITSLAERILLHRFPLLGIPELNLGPALPWRRDIVHGKETGLAYFRRIPYLDFARAGDHKLIWELNRHQHLVLLAQAYLLSQRPEFLQEIETQLTHWLRENPFQRGINWTSALEVAFRALSWLWISHWLRGAFPPSLRDSFHTALYRHGLHLEHNLSVYFSPNTHLLGEAVVLHALGLFFRGESRASHWERHGASIVIQEMERQVRADGSHFEQSTYYHVYSTDMFLFHAVLNPLVPTSYRAKLERMAEYLDACLPPSGALPFLGDDDGGRLFHPYGDRPRFALGALAAAGAFFGRKEWIRSAQACQEQAVWWLGESALQSPRAPSPSASRFFPDAGLAVFASAGIHALCDAGGFGALSAGHSHSDTLSLVLTQDGEELLIDSGTCTYVSDPALRASFRGSAAHNTIRIDGFDHATPRNSFAWRNLPQVEVLAWHTSATQDLLDAVCRYSGFAHRRTLLFLKEPRLLVIVDRLGGTPGPHNIEQFWHCPATPTPLGEAAYAIGSSAWLALSTPASLAKGIRSRAFAAHEPSAVLCCSRQGPFPMQLAAAIGFDRPMTAPRLHWESTHILRLDAARPCRFRFSNSTDAGVIE